MNCVECTDQLVAHLEGLLDESQQSRLESHLADCSTCRAEFGEMQHLFDRLVRRGRAGLNVPQNLGLTGPLILRETSRQRKSMLQRIAMTATAVTLLIAALAAVQRFFGGDNGIATVTRAAEQLRHAETLTWTDVVYQNVTSKDKTTKWVEITIRKCMWKAPGHQRTLYLDAQGRVQHIAIEDHMRGVLLFLDPGTKKARLMHAGVPRTGQLGSDIVTAINQTLLNGSIMEDPGSLGTKKINDREAIGFRFAREAVEVGRKGTGAGSVPWSTDLWIDAETKRLLLVHNPGVDIYDPEKDPVRHNRPGEGRSQVQVMGGVVRDIVFDEQLDDALFSVDPPDVYDVTKVGIAGPAENDIVACLGSRSPLSPARSFPKIHWNDSADSVPSREQLSCHVSFAVAGLVAGPARAAISARAQPTRALGDFALSR